ncbi:MAG: hypothetical protein L7U87_04020 [Chlamydiales bacterium]|nr:hypothetical protein [Chlamydiales bacterium]
MGDRQVYLKPIRPSDIREAYRPATLTKEGGERSRLDLLRVTGTRLLSSTAMLKVEDIAASLLPKSASRNKQTVVSRESAVAHKRIQHGETSVQELERERSATNKRVGGVASIGERESYREKRMAHSVKERLKALETESRQIGFEEEKAGLEEKTDPPLRIMGAEHFSPAQEKVYHKLFSGSSSYTRRQRGSVSDVMSRGIITATSFYGKGAVGAGKSCESLMPTREDFPNYIYYLKEDIKSFGFEATTTGVFSREDELLDSETQAAYVRTIARVRRSQNILEAPRRGIDLCRSTRDAYIETLLCRLRSGDLASNPSIGKAIEELMRINSKMAVIYEGVERAMSLNLLPEVKIDIDAISALKERLKHVCAAARIFYRYPHIEDLADQIIKCICEETTLKILQVRNRLVGEVLVSKSDDTKGKAEHINHLCHLADGLSSAAELEWLFRSRLDYHNPDHSLNEVAIPAHRLMIGVQEHLAACDLVVFSAAMRHDSRMVFADPSDRCSKRQFGKEFMQSEGASFKIWQDSMRRASEELFYIYPQLIRIFPNACLFSDAQLTGARVAIEKTVPEFLDFSSSASKSAGVPDGLDCV